MSFIHFTSYMDGDGLTRAPNTRGARLISDGTNLPVEGVTWDELGVLGLSFSQFAQVSTSPAQFHNINSFNPTTPPANAGSSLTDFTLTPGLWLIACEMGFGFSGASAANDHIRLRYVNGAGATVGYSNPAMVTANQSHPYGGSVNNYYLQSTNLLAVTANTTFRLQYALRHTAGSLIGNNITGSLAAYRLSTIFTP